jgi:hypothetical protein
MEDLSTIAHMAYEECGVLSAKMKIRGRFTGEDEGRALQEHESQD